MAFHRLQRIRTVMLMGLVYIPRRATYWSTANGIELEMHAK